MIPQPPSIGKQLLQALERFPRYAIEWTLGLLVAVLADAHITAVAVTAALLGAALGSVLWGLVAFFVLYAVSRICSNIANSIGFGLDRLASATYATAQVLEAQAHPPQTITVQEALADQ